MSLEDLSSRMTARLDGHLGQLRAHAVAPGAQRHRGGVPDDEHLGMTDKREVVVDDHPSRCGRPVPASVAAKVPVTLTPPAQMTATAFDELSAFQPDASRGDLGHGLVDANIDPAGSKCVIGVVGRFGVEAGKESVGGVEQDDAGAVGVDAQPVPAHRDPEQLHQRAGRLHPGGSAAHDHEGGRAVRHGPRAGRRRLRGCRGCGYAADGHRPGCRGDGSVPRRP